MRNYYASPKYLLAFLIITGLQLSVFVSQAQDAEKEPQRELGWGIKVVTRQIQYGKSSLFITDPGSISLQTHLRYDAPKKLSARRYFNLVGQAGFLFCKANVFDTIFLDANTNTIVRQHSKNPAYLPLYFGVYNRGAVSVGTEVFFWKGLGTRDIWGAKFLSLGYNGNRFRLMAAGEWYAQVRDGKNNGLLLSVDFLWKLISDKY
ncbi:MAG: hypothetical protein ABL876_05980 [Chitinophagaceae bacterium]